MQSLKIFRKKLATNDEKQSGVALLEFAITMLVLPTLFLSMVDYSTLILNYMTITQVVREGARFASATPQLEPGNHNDLFVDHPSNATHQACKPGGLPDSNQPCGHYAAQQRISYLMALHEHQLKEFSITSFYDSTALPAAGSNPGTTPETVTIEFTGVFDGLFIKGLPITVRSTAPYLQRSGA